MSHSASPLDVPPPANRGSAVVAGAGATLVHVALVSLAVFAGARFAGQIAKAPTVTELFDVEIPAAVTPPPEAPPPAPLPASKPTQHRVEPTPAAAPPAAAQAGPVLTVADQVVDFGDVIVGGDAPDFAGGATDGEGRSGRAVREPSARGSGAPPKVAAPAPVVDRSRVAQLAGGSAWDCPFPVEADDAGVDHAVVSLRIDVAADGHVLGATAARDPGHGFAREARRCALSKRWSAGLDRAGQPVNSTAFVNVRFDR